MDVDFNRNKIFSLLTEDEKQALPTMQPGDCFGKGSIYRP